MTVMASFAARARRLGQGTGKERSLMPSLWAGSSCYATRSKSGLTPKDRGLPF